MIYGTAAVGEIAIRNTEQAATARGGRGNVLPGRASLIPVMAGEYKSMEIPTRHSNKLCMNTAVLLDMVGGCVGGWGAVCTAVRDGCS